MLIISKGIGGLLFRNSKAFPIDNIALTRVIINRPFQSIISLFTSNANF